MFEIEATEQINGASIMVIGVGGAGNNAVNRMIDEENQGVEFVNVNTDAQVLRESKAPVNFTIGEKLTKGRGAGGRPEVGKQAAEENIEELTEIVKNHDMVFVTNGMGGGTGTGAAPVIARVSKEMGNLTIGVVTKPFNFEGKRRMRNALAGIEELKNNVDSLIVVPNQKLYEISDTKLSFDDAFRIADQTLMQSVLGITDLIKTTSLINLDFEDIKNVMENKGVTHIGLGYGQGDNKCMDAVLQAISSPLLETTIDGATDIIINFCGDLLVQEVTDAAEFVEEKAGEDANIIFGLTSKKDSMEGNVTVTIIATGLENQAEEEPKSAFSTQTYFNNVPNMKPNNTQSPLQGLRQPSMTMPSFLNTAGSGQATQAGAGRTQTTVKPSSQTGRAYGRDMLERLNANKTASQTQTSQGVAHVSATQTSAGATAQPQTQQVAPAAQTTQTAKPAQQMSFSTQDTSSSSGSDEIKIPKFIKHKK